MKKIIALFAVLVMSLGMTTMTAAPAFASTSCGKIKSTQDSHTFDNMAKSVTAHTTIYYKLCKSNAEDFKYVRNLSMVNTYNYEGYSMLCGIIHPFKGVKWTLYFNDVGGRNFSKKVDIGCAGDTVGTRYTDLRNTPRLYVYNRDGGYARWHGTVTQKMGYGIPDESHHLSGRYSTRFW